MLKLLIVDDEINICTLIKHLINWEELGITVIGTAQDGQKAYEMICQHHPDIVITDIKMPIMDGLELIKMVTENNIQTHFIIISGYKYFDYAYSAIKYGVQDYLLKPIIESELLSAAQKIVAEITQNKQQEESFLQMKKDIYLKEKHQRKVLIDQIIHHNFILPDKSLSELNKEYHYNFTDGLFNFYIISIYGKYPSSNSKNIICESIIDNIVPELKQCCQEIEYYESKNRVYFLTNYSKTKSSSVSRSIEYAFESILLLLKDSPSLYVTLSIGCESDSFQKISYSFKTALLALKCQYYVGPNKIIFADHLQFSEDPIEFIIPPKDKLKIQQSIDSLKEDLCFEAVDSIIAANSETSSLYPYSMVDLVKNIFENILFYFKTSPGFNADDLSKIKMKFSMLIANSVSREQLMSALKGSISAIFENCLTGYRQDTQAVNTVKQYVQSHYSEHIDLEVVSKLVYLSPAYLGILFKKITGLTFSTYLINVRMENAKSLLKEMKFSINEIAAMVGYRDTKYFSKLFKKYTGVKPTEYKKIYHFGLV